MFLKKYAHLNKTCRGLYTKQFIDVTMVSDDGQQLEAHKVIISSNSPLFCLFEIGVDMKKGYGHGYLLTTVSAATR